MTTSRRDIEDTRSTVEGLCGLAAKLGYRDPCQQLINNDGSCIGDLLTFFEDNPGAVAAVVEWVLDNGDCYDLTDEDESELEEDEDNEG